MQLNMNNQGPLVPKQRWTVGKVTLQLCRYVWAFAQLVAVLVLAAALCGAAVIGFRAVIFAVKTVTQALGI